MSNRSVGSRLGLSQSPMMTNNTEDNKNDMDVDDDEDVSAKAYAAIAASMEGWVSDSVGDSSVISLLGSSNIVEQKTNDDDELYAQEALEWMERDLPRATTTTATTIVERADTPVMSNKKSPLPPMPETPLVPPMDDQDATTPEPVQSPWVRQLVPPSPRDSMIQQTPSSKQRGTVFPSHEYRRYHDALLLFLKQKRNITMRLELQQQDSSIQQQNLFRDEKRIDNEFLSSLHRLCWDRSNNMRDIREGNLWLLLTNLRSLSLEALLWNDDNEGSLDRKQQSTIASFVQQVATLLVQDTPKNVLEVLTGENVLEDAAVPLVLQRRYRLVKWMEQCFHHTAKYKHPSVMPSSSSTLLAPHPDKPPLRGNNDDNDEEAKDLEVCLDFILAGRLSDAQEWMRRRGHYWRAALWGGGEPAGFQSDVLVGNVDRALWKRRLWALSQSKNTTTTWTKTLRFEAAIEAILADDQVQALSNPVLRSWDKALYVTLRAMWGRVEDALLHRHEEQRRQLGISFRRRYADLEKAQLEATSGLTFMSEASALQLLRSSPFEDVRGDNDLCCQAMAAFCVGRKAVMQYMINHISHSFAGEQQNDDDDDDDQEMKILNIMVPELRVLTHLALYLDSLSVASSPVEMDDDNISQLKNRILFVYVKHLADRQDLWHMVALYVSLLPEEIMMGFYPAFLTRVERDEERRVMSRQMRDLMPQLDFAVLRKVVRLVLSEEDPVEEELSDEDTALRLQRQLDMRKMKAINWLAFHPETKLECLICANILIRQFMLSDKVQSAVMFAADILPEHIIADDDYDDAMQDAYSDRLDDAKREFAALKSYLDAHQAIEEWRHALDDTSSARRLLTDSLNATELEIANSLQLRELRRRKRKDSKVVVQAAETARRQLLAVLQFPGGWLLVENEEDEATDSTTLVTMDDDPEKEEENERRYEMKRLRSQCLPYTVRLFHQVCEETASWMSRLLDEAVPALGSDSAGVLKALLDHSATTATTPLSPKYWLNAALELANLVASDAYDVSSAFQPIEMKGFLEMIAATAMEEMMQSV